MGVCGCGWGRLTLFVNCRPHLLENLSDIKQCDPEHWPRVMFASVRCKRIEGSIAAWDPAAGRVDVEHVREQALQLGGALRTDIQKSHITNHKSENSKLKYQKSKIKIRREDFPQS